MAHCILTCECVKLSCIVDDNNGFDLTYVWSSISSDLKRYVSNRALIGLAITKEKQGICLGICPSVKKIRMLLLSYGNCILLVLQTVYL